MNKYVGINSITAVINNFKSKFAYKQHVHDISEVEGLQERIDDLTPPPDIETGEDVIIRVNQLTNAVDRMTTTIDTLTIAINALIPAVGEIYITMSDEDPSSRFGGTWERIKDRFLLASGDLYETGSTGGESEHILTIDEIPSHVHGFQRHMLKNDDDGENTGESGYGVTNKTIDIYSALTTAVGGGQPHNNMPPYLAVYIWKRVA